VKEGKRREKLKVRKPPKTTTKHNRKKDTT
jgi:hypothetical protein